MALFSVATLTGAVSLLGKKSTWITLAVIVGVIFAGFAVVNYVATKSENMALKAKVEKVERERDQIAQNYRANATAVKTRNDLIDALSKVETVERVKTIEALKKNPDWAKQPIPADVIASLRE
jgi:hypothetical protein